MNKQTCLVLRDNNNVITLAYLVSGGIGGVYAYCLDDAQIYFVTFQHILDILDTVAA